MSSSARQATALLPLSEAVFQILLALVDGPRHGYAVMREVKERTEGRVRLGPGTLYGAIKRLCEQGILDEVEERSARPEGERRRCYRLTAFGQEVATLEARRLEQLLDAARRKKLLPAGAA